MASPFQQQALRRKLIYILLIVVLFTVSGMYRVFVVESKATDLCDGGPDPDTASNCETEHSIPKH